MPMSCRQTRRSDSAYAFAVAEVFVFVFVVKEVVGDRDSPLIVIYLQSHRGEIAPA